MREQPDTNQLRKLLVEKAKLRQTVDYKTVSKMLEFKPPNTIQQTTHLLEACQEDDALLQRPQIASLVVQKNGAPQPRPGFFEKLVELKVYEGSTKGSDAQMWHQNELEKAFDYYGK